MYLFFCQCFWDKWACEQGGIVYEASLQAAIERLIGISLRTTTLWCQLYSARAGLKFSISLTDRLPPLQLRQSSLMSVEIYMRLKLNPALLKLFTVCIHLMWRALSSAPSQLFCQNRLCSTIVFTFNASVSVYLIWNLFLLRLFTIDDEKHWLCFHMFFAAFCKF